MTEPNPNDVFFEILNNHLRRAYVVLLPPVTKESTSTQPSSNDAMRALFKESKVTTMTAPQTSSPDEVRGYQVKLRAAADSAIKICDVAVVVAIDIAAHTKIGKGKTYVPDIVVGHGMNLSQMPLGTIDSILDACAEEGLTCIVTASEPELYYAQMPSFREANVQFVTLVINESLLVHSSQPEIVERRKRLESVISRVF